MIERYYEHLTSFCVMVELVTAYSRTTPSRKQPAAKMHRREY